MNYSNNFECLCLSSSTLNVFQEICWSNLTFSESRPYSSRTCLVYYLSRDVPLLKGPVNLIRQVKIAHSLQSVKLVSFYHFKLTHVVLHMAVKEWVILILRVIWPTWKISCNVLLISYPKLLKDLFFGLTVSITVENMSCIHVKQ